MNAAFTITKDNAQFMSKMEEVRLAFSERHFACLGSFVKFVWQDGKYQWVKGDGTVADSLSQTKPIVTVGTDEVMMVHNKQSVAFFAGIQKFISSGGTVNIIAQDVSDGGGGAT